MKAEEKASIKSDKSTDFSFYVMFISLVAGFILTVAYVIFSFFE